MTSPHRVFGDHGYCLEESSYLAPTQKNTDILFWFTFQVDKSDLITRIAGYIQI